MADQPPGLFRFSGNDRRRVYQIDQRDVVSIKDLQKPIVLVAGVYFQNAARIFRVVRYQTHNLTVKPAKAGNQVFSILLFDFKVFTVVHQSVDDIVHVIG